MSQATILAKIKTTLEGISGIGQVHDYVRWNKDWPDLFKLFRDGTSEQIRFWDISRTRTPEVSSATRTNQRTHIFRIRGFISLDDSAATEKTFQSLVEDVAAAFRNQPTFGGAALDVEPLQIDNVNHASVGGVLCHMLEASLSVTEEVQWTES